MVTTMTGRGDAELEAALHQADRAIQEGEIFQDVRGAWSELPFDVRQQIVTYLRQLWAVRGAIPGQLLNMIASLVLYRGLSVIPATRIAVRQLGGGPGPASPGPLTQVQARQYRSRQMQRGRPGPRIGSPTRRRQRETESASEAEQAMRPEVIFACDHARRAASAFRRTTRRLSSMGNAGARSAAVRSIQVNANRWIRTRAGRLVPRFDTYTIREIDTLVSCLARMEWAVNAALPAMDAVRDAGARAIDQIRAREG
jgi:hypothetical protein